MFAERMKEIKPFIVMTLLERALELERQGKQIIHFEIGEPDFDTPTRIINGCIQEIKKGKTHYTHSLGFRDLRQEIMEYKQRTRGTSFDVDKQIMILSGTSPGFFLIMGALLNPGDEVIITDPGYPCYANFINFFGAVPKFLKIYEQDNFNVRVEDLNKLIGPRTKLLILNSPANPTGQIIPENTLDQIAEIVERTGIWVISDEIYAELTYNGRIAPSLSDEKFKRCHHRLIVLDGFSKFWAMTGWRLGYLIAPENLMQEMIKLQQNFLICAPSISQAAGLYALRCEEETKKMLKIYSERREYIVNRLNSIKGIRCLAPAGAFYTFANIKAIETDSMKFSFALLEKAGVAAAPGISFGPNGEGYIRFSYPTDIKNIEIGMNRLEKFVKEYAN
jgi:aspartate/methionine/tyrosine aminotransferase